MEKGEKFVEKDDELNGEEAQRDERCEGSSLANSPQRRQQHMPWTQGLLKRRKYP